MDGKKRMVPPESWQLGETGSKDQAAKNAVCIRTGFTVGAACPLDATATFFVFVFSVGFFLKCEPCFAKNKKKWSFGAAKRAR